jgi:hypothetical protein
MFVPRNHFTSGFAASQKSVGWSVCDIVCRVKNNPDLKFEVGDRVKFALRNGKIEEGVVRAVILTTKGPELNISFGPKGDLVATVNARQVLGKLPPLN